MSFDEMLEMFNRYPHILPGTTTPFELYLGAWSTAIDPDDGLSIFVSSAISDAEHPDNVNFGGFSDPAFDALVAAGRATYDQAERTRIYREAQQVLAAQVPYIFFWGFVLPDVVRSAVATVDGPLDLSVPNWSWQPERLVVAANP